MDKKDIIKVIIAMLKNETLDILNNFINQSQLFVNLTLSVWETQIKLWESMSFLNPLFVFKSGKSIFTNKSSIKANHSNSIWNSNICGQSNTVGV